LSKLIFHRKGVFDMIQPIKGVEKVNEVISGGNVIIGVSAPWCGYCRRLRPILEKISEEIDVPIYGLNFDEDQAVAEKYEVDTIPTLLFFRDGKPVDSIVGYGNVGYSELMEFVNKNNVK
ncbi:thioredoxin family protein, partial [Dialister invisus]